jgi:hypothetical protein
MIQGTGPLRQLLLAKSYGVFGYEVQSSHHYINAFYYGIDTICEIL